MSPDAPLLQLEGISKQFGPVHALDRVDFAVGAGEVVGLVGDNGAGKSTLVKAIAGINSPDSGTIRFEGKEVSISKPQDAIALGIATVYQDLALCDNLDVVANLFLGSEVRLAGPGHGLAAARRGGDGAPAPRSSSRTSRSRSPASAARSGRSPVASASRWRSPARCSANRKS